MIGIDAVVEQLNAAAVSVWLDNDGKLRIDRDAPVELKDLVREHKDALIEWRNAVHTMNAAGIRMIRLPLGGLALAYRLGTDLEPIRAAMKVLGKEAMPLVVDDEGLREMGWHDWQLRQRNRVGSEGPREATRQTTAAPRFERKTA